MTLCTTPLKYAVDGMYHDVGWGRVQCWGRWQSKAAGTTRRERVTVPSYMYYTRAIYVYVQIQQPSN